MAELKPSQEAIAKRALIELRQLRGQLDELEQRELRRAEPIAVIGLGCRFPGAASIEELWRLLREGRDAITEIPADRWDVDGLFDPDPDAAGKSTTRWGGYLQGIDRFDAEFFGVPPAEAAVMDPQQRLLLEVAWEALEHAGCPAERLQRTPVGVFIGALGEDYQLLIQEQLPLEEINPYLVTGVGHCSLAGRISYLLGLQGPSLAVETACSSSLVAAHLACQSLRAGESELALVGGVQLILRPQVHLSLSRARAMAADGRCKAFDASADGFTRSEGCGVVVLRRLSDALAAGDTVLALIRGSAVNHDGPSSAYTAPNGKAQEAVIRRALENAGVPPAAVSYLEAHGTGTALGDPIEMQALNAVFAPRAADARLAVGSIKTGIGHLESAAGVAGLIKVVLSLQHELIPPHLHLRRFNPHLEMERWPLVVPTAGIPWRRGGARRIAGLSSFGLSGTNAHLVLEEAPPAPELAAGPERPLQLLPLSAKSPAALDALARRTLEQLASLPEPSFPDACHTAGAGRSHFPERLALVAASSAEASAALAGQGGAGILHRGEPGAEPADLVLLFSGQGAQHAGMARALHQAEPRFRAAIERCAAALAGELEVPLLEVLYGEAGARLDQTEYTQPALFAVEWSLHELLRGLGLRPAAVIGHSLGEYVAACAAGVLDLEPALRLVARRGRLMQALPERGGMLAAMIDEPTARSLIAGRERDLSLAAVNAPESMVLSGREPAIAEVAAELERRGARCKHLNVSHAMHSPVIEPILDPFRALLEGVELRPPRLPLVSNLSGRLAGDEVTRPEYWVRHVREPVRFLDGIRTLRRDGRRLFLEVGPTPVLLALGQQCLPDQPGAWVPLLRRGADDWRVLLGALAEVYVHGLPLDFAALDRGLPRRRIAAPSYPFQRRRHWLPEAAARPSLPLESATLEAVWRTRPAPAPGPARPGHLLLLSDDPASGDALLRTLAASLPARLAEEPLDEARLEGAAGVVFLADAPGTEPEPSGEALLDALAPRLLSLLRVLQRLARRGGPPLTLVTRGAVALGGSDLEPRLAPLWGLARVAQLEHPELGCRMIDLDPGVPLAAALAPLAGELLGAGPEGQVAYRAGTRQLKRLVRRRFALPPAPLRLRGDRSYLVSGGLGAMGLLLARWLLEHGARQLVLLGRRGASGESQRIVLELAAEHDATIRALSVDLSRAPELEAVLGQLRAELPPLAGVFHLAGVLADRSLLELEAEPCRAVLAPKIAGAWNLHRLTAEDPLEHFVLFSSLASLVGAAGQASYAAGNAFLDALAAHRLRAGKPALSINWGPWEVGMAGRLPEEARQRLGEAGLHPIAPEAGLAVLERLLSARRTAQVGVVDVDFSRLAASGFGDGGGLLAELLGEARAPEASPPGASAPAAATTPEQELLRGFLAAPGANRGALVQAYVHDAVRRNLGREGALDERRPLSQLGLDSLMFIDLRNRLRNGLKVDLPISALMSGMSLGDLIQQLTAQLAELHGVTAEPAPAPVAATGGREEAIARGILAKLGSEELMAKLERFSEEELDLLMEIFAAAQ